MYVLFSAYISVSGIMLVFQPWQINVVCFTLNVGVEIAAWLFIFFMQSHTYVAQHGYRCIDI